MMQFTDLSVRQLSKEITLLIYQEFPLCKDYGFKDQIQRASVSIMNNIAEGFERGSLKDKQRFFVIAKGSTGEVRSLLLLVKELGYMSEDSANNLIQKTYSISKMLQGLISNSKY